MVGFLCRSLWRHVLVITCGLDLTEDKERRSDQSIDGLVLCYLRGFHCHQSHQTAHSAEPKHFFSHSFCLRHHDELYWHGNLNVFKMCIGCCCFPFCRLDACTGTGQVKHGPVFQTLLSIFMKSLTLVSARDSNTARQPMCRSAYAHAGWVGDYFQHLKAKPAELSGTTLIFSGILNGEDIAFLQKCAIDIHLTPGGWLFAQTSEGPFSAVSKPIFAAKLST